MLGARWHKILYELWGNKTRTALIVLSISVGLIAVGMIVSAQVVLSQRMAGSYAAAHPSTGTIRIAETFDENLLRSIRRLDGVADADGRRNLMIRYRLRDLTTTDCQDASCAPRWRDVQLFAVPDFEEMRLNVVEPVSGTWPPLGRQVVIERSALEMMGVTCGDLIVVETADRKQKELRVVGAARDLAMVPSPIDGTARGYIGWETLDYLGLERGYSELHILVEEGSSEERIRQVLNRVQDRMENIGYSVPMSLSSEPGQVPLDSILQAVLLLLGVLGFLSLFLSVFLIVNTVSAMIAQQTRQIGIMKSIGARSSQIVAMYLLLVAVYGLAALVLAVPLGALGARGFSIFMADFFNFDLGVFRTPVVAVVLQVVVGLVVPVLAALFPVLAVAKISVAQAINNQGAGGEQFGGGVIDGWLTHRSTGSGGILSRPLTLSLRNTFRRKGRLALTLITLTLGGMIFISIFSVRSSMAQTLADLTDMYRSDLWVNFTYSQRVERAEQQAIKAPGVKAAEAWVRLPVRRMRDDGSEGDSMLLYAPPVPADLLHPKILEGRWLRSDDRNAVVFSTGAYNVEPDVKVGQRIVLKVDGKEVPFTVVGTSLGFGMASFVYAGYDDIARITEDIGHASSLMVVTGSRDRVALNEAATSLENHLRAQGIRVSSIQVVSDETAGMRLGFSVIIALCMLMAALLAAVGGMGLMGTVGINVLERTREIGVMRAIGAGNAAVARVFIVEAILIGLISWLFSALLALPVSGLLSRALGMAFLGSPLSFRFSPAGVVIWLAVVVLLSTAASFVPARNASRLTVREVLAYE